LADAHRWLDSIVRRLEGLEKGAPGSLDCTHKVNIVQELVSEMDSQGNTRVEDVKKLAELVTDAVNNLGKQTKHDWGGQFA